jgi:hypothetical protein
VLLRLACPHRARTLLPAPAHTRAAWKQGKVWREAVRAALCHGRSDLVDTLVAPLAAEAAASLLAEATAATGKVAKYLARLREVGGSS